MESRGDAAFASREDRYPCGYDDAMPARRDDIPPKEHCHAAIVDALRSLGGVGDREQIVERAVAEGGFSADQLRVQRPPSKVGVYPTYVAYRLSWALTELRRDGVVG